MNVYQNAVDALKECVKQSMESDVPSNTQGEIWSHYQGMKTIAEQLKDADDLLHSQFFPSESEGKDLYDPDYNIQAAQPVDLDFGGGTDVITFS